MVKYRKNNLNYKGFPIHISQSNGLISLTDMWRAKGFIKSKETDKWLLREDTCDLLLQLVLEVKPELKLTVEEFSANKPAPNSGSKVYRAWASQVRKLAKQVELLQTKGGKSAGTYAIGKLAIAYAESLSSEFHAWVLNATEERIEEDADPELGIRRSRQRAVRRWEKQGKSPDYIQARLESIPREDYYEKALYQHGVRQPREFAWCKAMVYQPIIGKTEDFRSARKLKKGQNCKDGMTIEELTSTDFAKILSAKRINTLSPDGAKSCASISHSAAKQVALLLNQ